MPDATPSWGSDMTAFICALLILAGIIWGLTAGVHLTTALALTAIAVILAVTVFTLGLPKIKAQSAPIGFAYKNIAPFHGFGAFGWMLILMIMLTACSLIPLPLGLLDLLSPKAAELYRNTWALAGIDRSWGYLTASREATSYALWILIGYLGFYLTALRLGATRKNTTILAHSLALAGIALTGMFALKYAGYPLSIGQTGPHALFHIGTPVNANHAAGVFVFLAIFALGNCLSKRHKDTVSRKLLWFILYLTFSVLVFMLKSRGAILAWGLGQAFFAVFTIAFRKQLKPVHLILLGCGSAIAFAAVLCLSAATVSEIRTEFENTTIAFDYTEDDTSGDALQKAGTFSKTQMYGDFLKMGADWGRAGTGRSAFGDIYPAYQGFPFSKTFKHAENEYWEILLEYGWFWGAICLLLGAAAIFLYLKGYARAKDERECMIGLLAAVLALLIQNLFDFNLRYWTVGLIFWIACGTLEARRNRWNFGKIEHDTAPISKRNRIEYLAGAALAAVACIMALTALPAAINSQTASAQTKAMNALKNADTLQNGLSDALQKPLAYRPADLTIYSAVASAYIRKGSQANTWQDASAAWTLAQKWLEAATKLAPHDALFTLRLAKCYLALRDQDKAAKLFLQASAEDPKLISAAMFEMAALSEPHIVIPQSYPAFRSLLQALLKRERIETAHTVLLRDSQTADPVRHAAQACLFYHHIDMDEACDALLESLDNQPVSMQLLTLKAASLSRHKQYEQLIDLYEDAEPTLKNDPEYWRMRLHAYVYHGSVKGASWYKEQIPSLFHGYRAYTGISSLYAFNGYLCDARYALNIQQYGRAARSAKLALKVRPGHKEAQAILNAATEAQKKHK